MTTLSVWPHSIAAHLEQALADPASAALAERGLNVNRASIDGFHRPQAERG